MIVTLAPFPRAAALCREGGRHRQGPPDVAMGSAAAGERVRGLGQGPTPCQQV